METGRTWPVLDLEDATKELRRLSRLLDDGLAALRSYAQEYADAEMNYREAQAKAWLVAPRLIGGTKITTGEREAWVNGETRAQRRTRDYADDMRKAALEAVRSRRGQISAWQSLLAAERAEMEMSRYGPE